MKKSAADVLFTVSGQPEKVEQEMGGSSVGYSVVNGVGYLRVRPGDEEGNDMNAQASLFSLRLKRTWTLYFFDPVPPSLSISLDAGTVDVAVTDLKIRDLTLHAGA